MKVRASDAQLPTTAGGAITSAGPAVGDVGEVGEHGRRLAEAHVEGEAAADAGLLEEAEPGERVGLVGAQLADEAVGLGGRLARHVGRGGEELGGPAAPADGDAPGQRGPLEPEGEAQHVGAGEPSLIGPLGERLGGGLRGRPGRPRPSVPASG